MNSFGFFDIRGWTVAAIFFLIFLFSSFYLSGEFGYSLFFAICASLLIWISFLVILWLIYAIKDNK